MPEPYITAYSHGYETRELPAIRQGRWEDAYIHRRGGRKPLWLMRFVVWPANGYTEEIKIRAHHALPLDTIREAVRHILAGLRVCASREALTRLRHRAGRHLCPNGTEPPSGMALRIEPDIAAQVTESTGHERGDIFQAASWARAIGLRPRELGDLSPSFIAAWRSCPQGSFYRVHQGALWIFYPNQLLACTPI